MLTTRQARITTHHSVPGEPHSVPGPARRRWMKVLAGGIAVVALVPVRCAGGGRTRLGQSVRAADGGPQPGAAAHRDARGCAVPRGHRHVPGAGRPRTRHAQRAVDHQWRAHHVLRHRPGGQRGRLLERGRSAGGDVAGPALGDHLVARADPGTGDRRPGAEPGGRPGARHRRAGDRECSTRPRAATRSSTCWPRASWTPLPATSDLPARAEQSTRAMLTSTGHLDGLPAGHGHLRPGRAAVADRPVLRGRAAEPGVQPRHRGAQVAGPEH